MSSSSGCEEGVKDGGMTEALVEIWEAELLNRSSGFCVDVVAPCPSSIFSSSIPISPLSVFVCLKIFSFHLFSPLCV